jgi:hypothetical protein
MSDQPEQLREGQVTPSIDINDRKDRALIRTAVSRRWPVKQELREKVVDALDRAMTVAQEQGDVGAIVDVSKTLVVIEGQNQTDDHLADKNDRLDQGKLTERVAVEPVILERPVRPTSG